MSEEMPLEGLASPPMANGELVFEQPWQSRVFGMARTLSEQGYYEWDEFRHHLIKHIEQWDEAKESADYDYYHHFLAALVTLINEKGLCSTGELDIKTSEFLVRPHGHDH